MIGCAKEINKKSTNNWRTDYPQPDKFAVEQFVKCAHERLETNYRAQTCYEEINFKNPRICDFMPIGPEVKHLSDLNPSDLKDDCFLSALKLTDDIRLCKELVGMWAQVDCYEHIARTSNNFSVCSQADSILVSSHCYERIASNTNNKLLCNNILENDLKFDCILQLSQIKKMNVSYCGNFKDIDNKNVCYIRFAEVMNDTSICREVSGNSSLNFNKDYCLQRVASYDNNNDIATNAH